MADRLVGALGIAGFALFLIEVYRVDLTVADVRMGAWVSLAGAGAALIGGFMGSRRAVMAPVSSVQTSPRRVATSHLGRQAALNGAAC